MSEFLHDTDATAKAIAIPWVFSENSRAKNSITNADFNPFPNSKFYTLPN